MHTLDNFSILNALQISVTLFPKTKNWLNGRSFQSWSTCNYNMKCDKWTLVCWLKMIPRVASALLRKETIFSVWSFVFFTIVKPVYFLITPRILKKTNFEYWIAWFVYVYSSWRRGRNRARRREYFHRCPPAHIKAHVLLNTPRELYDIWSFVTHTSLTNPHWQWYSVNIIQNTSLLSPKYYFDAWPV